MHSLLAKKKTVAYFNHGCLFLIQWSHAQSSGIISMLSVHDSRFSKRLEKRVDYCFAPHSNLIRSAYNLECLEGNFYNCAAFGTPLDSSITGGGPAPSSESFELQIQSLALSHAIQAYL